MKDPATNDTTVNHPDMRPWLPRSLREHGLTRKTVRQLVYVVVDDIDDQVAVLAVYPWPVADKAGRVRFLHLDDCRHVAISRQRLESQLYRKLIRRPPRSGDVFGASLTEPAREWLNTHQDTMWPRALDSFLHGSVYDLSSDARGVAKLAYYAAMTPVLAKEHVDQWNLAEKTEPPAQKARTMNIDTERKAQDDA
jgi:hypothetical protein